MPYPQSSSDFMYFYCSWLLIKKESLAFFSAQNIKETNKGKEIDFLREYKLPIGEPQEERFRLNSCWARKYQNALIVVNPTELLQTVSLGIDKQYWDYSSQTVVSNTIKIPPRGGHILFDANALGLISQGSNKNFSSKSIPF